MPKSRIVSVFWTDKALENAISIKGYLLQNFSENEVDNFFSLLNAFEIAVGAFPELYPLSSDRRGIRRAVLSKVLSAFYRIRKNNIEVLAILDNRCDLAEMIG
jgi:plasmid stabilization system protein ParE